ncbi:response regulator [Bacteroidota bacterium]
MDQEDQNQGSDKKPFSILVVEDNFINQRLILASLARFGHKVECASNGQIAVEMYREKSYDVILMDIMMPVMDGVTACKAIREMEKERIAGGEKRMKIIAVTANAFDDDMDTFLKAGMDEVMNKPVDIEALQRMLYG